MTTLTSVNSNTQTIMVSKGVKLLDASYRGTVLTETALFWTNSENGEHKYKAVFLKQIPISIMASLGN